MCNIKISASIITILVISTVHSATPTKDKNTEEGISDLPLTSEDPNSSKSVEDEHTLESHEAMQQNSMGSFDAFLTGMPPQTRPNKFHGGKLIIDEQEPPNHEDIDILSEPEPTPAMLRTLRNVPSKEPDPKASESLLELLVTIAGQPERWKSLIAYVDAVLKSPIALNSDLDRQLKKYQENANVVENAKITKPPLRQMEYKIERDDEKEKTESIEHMIIFLQNQNDKLRSSKTELPWPIFDVETTPNTFDIKESVKRENVGENVEEIDEVLNTTTPLRKSSWANDEKGLREYDSKYNDDKVKLAPTEGKLIDELHKLETFNKQTTYNDMDNIREYESKFDLHDNITKKKNESGSRLFLKRTEYMYPGGFQQTQESNEAARNFLQNKFFMDNTYNENWPDFDSPNPLKKNNVAAPSSTTLKPKFSKPRDWFSFRRVTIGPNENFDKTRARNAYIAVSVIAPTMRKYYRSNSEVKNDAIENQLRSLKPWSHTDNLSQMKKLRANWPILESDQSVN